MWIVVKFHIRASSSFTNYTQAKPYKFLCERRNLSYGQGKWGGGGIKKSGICEEGVCDFRSTATTCKSSEPYKCLNRSNGERKSTDVLFTQLMDKHDGDLNISIITLRFLWIKPSIKNPQKRRFSIFTLNPIKFQKRVSMPTLLR